MVLAKNQKHRSMEQDREPGNKLHFQANKYLTEQASTYNGLKIINSINGVGKIGQTHAEK